MGVSQRPIYVVTTVTPDEYGEKSKYVEKSFSDKSKAQEYVEKVLKNCALYRNAIFEVESSTLEE